MSPLQHDGHRVVSHLRRFYGRCFADRLFTTASHTRLVLCTVAALTRRKDWFSLSVEFLTLVDYLLCDDRSGMYIAMTC